jgi:hypothetical protein
VICVDGVLDFEIGSSKLIGIFLKYVPSLSGSYWISASDFAKRKTKH